MSLTSIATNETYSNPNTAYLNQDDQDALKAAMFRRLHPRLYLERYIVENFRPDGRLFGDFRGVSVNVGSISTADGSSLVRMGNTTIVCGIKAEIAEPELDRGDEGFLVPNLDLPAMCSPKFKPGPPSEEAQVLSDKLNEVFVTSNFLPLTTLCIEKNKSVWVLYVDATCLNYDGNMFDASLLAMVAALKNTTLPKAVYNFNTHQTVCYRRAPRVSLQLSPSIPLCASFGIFDLKEIFADPTSFEETLLGTTISVVLGNDDRILLVSQLGLAMLSSDDKEEGGKRNALPDCIERAKQRRKDLLGILLR